MSIFENNSFFCMLRYDILERSTKCVIFFKPIDQLQRRPLGLSNIVTWLDCNVELLRRHPLLVLSAFLGLVQFRAHEFLRWRLELYEMEARLGVTRDGESLKRGGYSEVSHDFTTMNADLATLSKKIADNELSASTILEHAKSLQRLILLCEDYENVNGASAIHSEGTTEQREEIQAVITRAELYLAHSKMLQDVLRSLEAVLYNRINKQETQSMKTIAVVTLVFLPGTLVSAIFSTGIFNFQASEPPGSSRIISKYGWVYLITCILSTVLTLVSWVCWYRWGRIWLEKLEFTHVAKAVTHMKFAEPYSRPVQDDSSRHIAMNFYDGASETRRGLVTQGSAFLRG